MIRPIMRDPIFLVQKSAPAMAEDLTLARDLLETLEASKDRCVGMAANMIGVSRRVIAFDNGGTYMAMFNPEIVKSSGPRPRSPSFHPERSACRNGCGATSA